MRYWLEPRWPPVDNDQRRGPEVLEGLWFHEGKRHIAGKMRRGDMALLYETGLHPDTRVHGARAIVAWGTVTDTLRPCEAHRADGKLWNITVPFEVKEHVPWHQTQRGVPLEAVRRVIKRTRPGWSDRAKIITTLELQPAEFEALRQELEARIALHLP